MGNQFSFLHTVKEFGGVLDVALNFFMKWLQYFVSIC